MARTTNTQIAADLRGIKTLTLDEIERINTLRRDRKSLQTRLDNLPVKKTEYETAILQTEEDEEKILVAAKARMPAAQPSDPQPIPAAT